MSAPSVLIELPGTIRGKGRPRFARATGRAYTPAQTVNYEAALKMVAVEAMAGKPLFEGAVELMVVATFDVAASWSKKRRLRALLGEERPTKKPDADNIIKLTDALNGIVWKDDAQVAELRFKKQYGDRPGLVLRVTAI